MGGLHLWTNYCMALPTTMSICRMDRLAEDVKMMKAANINVVRIAESTWSTHEPQEGVFDFRHVTRVLERWRKPESQFLSGTPTYAIPDLDGKGTPGYPGDDEAGTRYLRCAANHGYYASGISFLCRADHSEADGGNGTPENVSLASSSTMRRSIMTHQDATYRSGLSNICVKNSMMIWMR